MSLSRVIADDGMHFEHFVLSSADAERGADGEMRFRLLRPLKKVKSIRLVYADLPKTTRTLDLLVDVATTSGRLATQQLARSIRANENDNIQRSTFGRIFVQDFETDDFFDDIVSGAFSKGTIPRFLYENTSGRYMRFEFRPPVGAFNTVAVRLYSSLLDQYGQTVPYTPDLFVVTTGTALRDRNSTLAGTDALAKVLPLLLQSANTTIRIKPMAALRDYAKDIDNFFSELDYGTVAASPAAGQALMEDSDPGAPLPDTFLSIDRKLFDAPDVTLQIADASPASLDALGIVAAPCQYSLKSLPQALYRFLFESRAYELGVLHPVTWLTRGDVTVTLQDQKPPYPVAFRAETYTYSPEIPIEQDRERNVQAVRIQRCVVEVSPELMAVLAHPDPAYDTDPFRRLRLKYLLLLTQVRTRPQRRPVHGVLNSTLKAELAQFYSPIDVLFVDPALRALVVEKVRAETGREISPSAFLVAVEFDRSLSVFSDSEVLRSGGAPADLVCSRHRYEVDGGNGFAVDWELDALLAASFPFTLTFEAEIEQYQ